MARLSTHVLDTAIGRPAVGVAYIVYRIRRSGEDEDREKVASGVTNADGRTDQPLLEGDAFTAGTYELCFDAGAYLRTQGRDEAPFFDRITLRFIVSDPTANYHVPLLLSPWSYTTYRGC